METMMSQVSSMVVSHHDAQSDGLFVAGKGRDSESVYL